MRTFLLAAALMAFASPAAADIRNFGVNGFDKVRVEGPFRVRLTTGVAPFAKASGSSAALDRLSLSVEGDTLVVQNSADSWDDYPGRDAGPVQISVGTHELSAAWLNGSGTLSIDHVKGLTFGLSIQGSGASEIGQADVDQLDVSVAGTASARLGGQAKKLTAVVRGISSLDAGGLSITDATLGIDGSGTIAAKVTGTVTLDATGPATVRLSGGGACTLRVDGAATVSGCR